MSYNQGSYPQRQQRYEQQERFEQPEAVQKYERYDQADMPRKLVIHGLPWDTSEDTFRMYFAQFGTLEHCEIMKDRYTGKSRGFGFVTFMDPAAAHQCLVSEHAIDGRRCEAQVAVPKGEVSVGRTTRIFVARIPPSVTEAQFITYFEAFGDMLDAYMPKDFSKQSYRGIGFVTYATPDSVEQVMATKHWLNGYEIAVDRANPKGWNHFQGQPAPQGHF